MARNLRKLPRVSYYELEEPNLDQYLFCTNCRDMVYEYCSIHGPLLDVPDAVPLMSKYPSFVPKAALTVPKKFLHIAPSNIPGAGLGIFTSMALPEGVRFGPFVGEKVKDSKSAYCWQIYDSKQKPCHVIDASDANKSNWMRYVNCSRHWIEQNLVAYQYQGHLYYRTCKLIPRHTELLVYYGNEFGTVLRINFRRYNKVPLPPLEYINGSLLLKEKTKSVSCSYKIDIVAPVHVNGVNNIKRSEETVKVPTISSKIEVKALTLQNVQDSMGHPSIESTEAMCATHHFTEHILTNNYYCDHCNRKFTSKLILSEHVAKHMISNKPSQKKSYKCDVCQIHFRESSALSKHVRIHTGEKPYKCDVCQKHFRQSSALRGHVRIHTGEKPYKCDVCQKHFRESSTLSKHVRIHTGEKPYKCDVCHKHFRESSTLSKHVRIHTGEKPYKCDVCQKHFRESSTLSKHVRIHTGEKPYKCDVCQKHFRESSALSKHVRIHTGEKPYKCDVCQKHFRESSALSKHVRIHTGEKPYKCDVCQKQFRNSSGFHIHQRIHTGEKPYKCNVCQSQFNTSSFLRRHVKGIHAEQ